MLLGYFTEEAYNKLLHDIQRNTENYSSPDEWLSTYFGGNDYFKMSSVDVSFCSGLYSGEKRRCTKVAGRPC